MPEPDEVTTTAEDVGDQGFTPETAPLEATPIN
jgi:hypothetical protein